MGVPDVDSRSAEEMADSMLWDSPLPETEEEWKQAKDIPTGEFTIPLPANLEFLPFVRHFNNFLLGPLNQEDPLGKVAATPHVEASLVVGASTSVAPSGGAPPPVDMIKLAQENMDLVKVCVTECQKVGASTSVAPSGGAPPPVDMIKLA